MHRLSFPNFQFSFMLLLFLASNSSSIGIVGMVSIITILYFSYWGWNETIFKVPSSVSERLRGAELLAGFRPQHSTI